ncbi:hypothetical protein O181_038442 [Austropuccinia psidii MF-1]|uniref:Uncharacterized protein n=1 Tax=Austropuccinia psidii MF-1 TaxID=1389203 RepID=A0A9Q3DAY2_9BASI|nr:hypothetical protein [Austropuccinia psidii MF-1]
MFQTTKSGSKDLGMITEMHIGFPDHIARQTGSITPEAEALQRSIEILDEEQTRLQKYSRRRRILDFEANYNRLHQLLNGIVLQRQAHEIETSNLSPGSMETGKILHSPELIETKESSSRKATVGREPVLRAASDSEITNGAGKDLVADLIEILHHFRKSRQDGRLLVVKQNEVGGVLALEKCIFQALDLMYTSGIATKDDLQSIIANPMTVKFNLQLLAEHLRHLYSTGGDIWSADHALVPKLEFIMTDWKTADLHNLLQVLDYDERAYLVYFVLHGLLERWLNGIGWERNVPQAKFIFKSIRELNMFEPASGVKATKTPNLAQSSNDKVSEVVNQMIIFLSTCELDKLSSRLPSNYYQTFFLLNYYMLDFARRYTTPESELIAKEFEEDDVLRSQYRMIKIGLQIHQYVDEILDDESNAIHTKYDEKIRKLSKEYLFLKDLLSKWEPANTQVNNNLVLTYFTQLASVEGKWLYGPLRKNLWHAKRQQDLNQKNYVSLGGILT